MNPDHSRYADWDAAYVLGALGPADRAEYEAHLEHCDRCRRAVGELAPMPGLLSRLSPDRAMALLDEPSALPAEASRPGPGLLDAVRLEGRRRTRRSRTGIAVFAAAAAAAVLAAVVLPTVLTGAGHDARAVAFATLADVPVSASATLEPVAWGTRIELDCSYAESPAVEAPEAGWTYGLFVVGEDGARTELSTWRAAPGASARLEAGTALGAEEIAALEIRAMGSGEVLLRAELD